MSFPHVGHFPFSGISVRKKITKIFKFLKNKKQKTKKKLKFDRIFVSYNLSLILL